VDLLVLVFAKFLEKVGFTSLSCPFKEQGLAPFGHLPSDEALIRIPFHRYRLCTSPGTLSRVIGYFCEKLRLRTPIKMRDYLNELEAVTVDTAVLDGFTLPEAPANF
jgi:hypothetical protein